MILAEYIGKYGTAGKGEEEEAQMIYHVVRAKGTLTNTILKVKVDELNHGEGHDSDWVM